MVNGVCTVNCSGISGSTAVRVGANSCQCLTNLVFRNGRCVFNCSKANNSNGQFSRMQQRIRLECKASLCWVDCSLYFSFENDGPYACRCPSGWLWTGSGCRVRCKGMANSLEKNVDDYSCYCNFMYFWQALDASFFAMRFRMQSPYRLRIPATVGKGSPGMAQPNPAT